MKSADWRVSGTGLTSNPVLVQVKSFFLSTIILLISLNGLQYMRYQYTIRGLIENYKWLKPNFKMYSRCFINLSVIFLAHQTTCVVHAVNDNSKSPICFTTAKPPRVRFLKFFSSSKPSWDTNTKTLLLLDQLPSSHSIFNLCQKATHPRLHSHHGLKILYRPLRTAA